MECGGCTLCCKLINVPWMNSPAGEYCKECVAGKGCKIYDTVISKNCLDYQCAYAQQEKASINLRPDICHVIFEKLNNRNMIGLVEENYSISDDVKSQIKLFIQEGLSVTLVYLGNPVPAIIPAEGRTGNEVYNEVKDHIRKLNGSSGIHN